MDKISNGKMIQMPLKDLQSLMTELENCKKDKAKLEKAVEFLNNEIDKYNKEFTKPEENIN